MSFFIFRQMDSTNHNNLRDNNRDKTWSLKYFNDIVWTKKCFHDFLKLNVQTILV